MPARPAAPPTGATAAGASASAGPPGPPGPAGAAEQALFAPRAVYPGAPHLPGYPGPAPEAPQDIVDALARRRKAAVTVARTGGLLLLFGVVCMITSLVFSVERGTAVKGVFPPAGGTIGPIVVTEPNTVLQIDFAEPLSGYGWSYVNGELSDDEDVTLYAFGGDMWHEKGYDDGAWDEKVESYDIKLTIPEKGNYFLSVSADPQPGTPIGGNISVSVRPVLGSSVPHFAGGLFGLLVGFVLLIVGSKMLPTTKRSDDDD